MFHHLFRRALPLEVVVVADPGQRLADGQPSARLGLVVGGLPGGAGKVAAALVVVGLEGVPQLGMFTRLEKMRKLGLC